jgi:GNAT superfamily N-acetyltransferase
VDARAPRVRQGTLEDAPELARLRWRFRDELGTAEEPLEVFRERFNRFLESAFAGGAWAAFVADVDGRLVGSAYVQIVQKVPVPNDLERHAFGYLTNVYVEPEARSGGLGARLVEAAVAWAGEHEPDALVLWPNEASVRFWERAGFAPPEDLLERRLDR